MSKFSVFVTIKKHIFYYIFCRVEHYNLDLNKKIVKKANMTVNQYTLKLYPD